MGNIEVVCEKHTAAGSETFALRTECQSPVRHARDNGQEVFAITVSDKEETEKLVVCSWMLPEDFAQRRKARA